MGVIAPERQQRFDRSCEEAGERRRLSRVPRSREAGAHGRPTLDDLIVGVWEGLAVRGIAGCPVCGGRMLSTTTPPAEQRQEGHCQDCGSTLT